MQSYGARIDGVGLQSHFIVGETPSTSSQQQNMAAFTALGVEVAITELDIRMQLPETEALLTQQATDYQSTVQACANTKGCVGITVWDWTDKYSWVPSTFSGYGDACPWDANYQKKPAYEGILTGLGQTVTSTTYIISPTTSVGTGTTTSSGGSGGATGVAQHWEQCGGLGWTGPTVCASGYTCTVINEYYSQCL